MTPPNHRGAPPVPWNLLPESAGTDARGSLTIGGCSVAALAATYGTPLFIYDEAQLRARCREAVEAFGDEVAYATKAFLCTAMARLAAEEGMVLDVSTLGELHVALHAGVDPSRLVLHGNNKSTAELSRALEVGVHRIICDSTDELDRLEVLAAAGGVRPKIWIRVTPGVEAHTHAYVQTGQEDSKFGFSVASGAAAAAVERIAAKGLLELCGVHAHIGSQVFDVASFGKAAEVLGRFFAPLGLGELCVGGGLGVAYVAGEEAPSFGAWAATVRGALAAVGIGPEVRISAEPGRAIVASAAITVYEVGTIKDLPGLRTYLSVDGGMSDNPRPVLYGSGYEAMAVAMPKAERVRAVRIVGKHCESGDVIVPEAFLPAEVGVGDLIATPVTGAYGYSMASNYNKVPRPAVVFVADGRERLVVRRETLEDLVRLDLG